jgi:hypothetical protein
LVREPVAAAGDTTGPADVSFVPELPRNLPVHDNATNSPQVVNLSGKGNRY